MQDERNTPQDEDEVEAHSKFPAPTESKVPRSPDEDDDEVEAHGKMPAPSESKFPHPSQ